LNTIVIPGSAAPAYSLDSIASVFSIHCYKGTDVERWAKEEGYPIIYLNTPKSSELLLPLALSQIEAEAFANSAVESVIIPSGCVSIDAYAFANCSNLVSIYMPDSVISISEDAFEGCDNVLFICESENTAASYATEHNIPYSIE